MQDFQGMLNNSTWNGTTLVASYCQDYGGCPHWSQLLEKISMLLTTTPLCCLQIKFSIGGLLPHIWCHTTLDIARIALDLMSTSKNA